MSALSKNFRKFIRSHEQFKYQTFHNSPLEPKGQICTLTELKKGIMLSTISFSDQIRLPVENVFLTNHYTFDIIFINCTFVKKRNCDALHYKIKINDILVTNVTKLKNLGIVFNNN